MLLNNLALFLRIVEKGGMASAGREFGLSPASVSERLAALESYYGASLLTRTTRAISLTDAGRTLVEGARRLLAEAEELESSIRLGSQLIAGPIRITAAQDLGQERIVPIVDAFLTEHPATTVDLNLTDGYVDLVAQGMDFAVRQGPLADSRLRSRLLHDNRRVVCAAPAYLAANGKPEHPDDLLQHDCLLMRFGQNIDREWSFIIDGKPYRIAVHGRRIANDGRVVRKWCLAGFGIALKSFHDVEADLASGTLVELLSGFSSKITALQIVYPSSSVQPRRVRLLMDKIVAAFNPEDQA